MPRPLSVTASQPPSSRTTSIKVAWPGHRLVHRIVDNLGKEMMHRVGVGAADIHAGTAAHWLEALEDLD